MEKKNYEKIKKKAKKLYQETETDKNHWKHVKKVKKIAECLGKKLDLSESEMYLIKCGAILHDIGKTENAKNTTKLFYGDIKGHHRRGKAYIKYLPYFDIKKHCSEKEYRTLLQIIRRHRKNQPYRKCKKDGTVAAAITIVRLADKLANGKIDKIKYKE